MLRRSMQSGHSEASESVIQIIGKGFVTTPEEGKFMKPYLSRTKTHH